MRRADKEIRDRPEIDEVIRGSLVCRVALARDNAPYLVPMSFGYDGSAIYLHTAGSGKKIDWFEANPQVCFEFERNVELRRDPRSACAWTFAFESVIGYGTIREVTGPEAKERALNALMAQYSGREWPLDPAALDRTRVWRIDIASLTGKCSRTKPDIAS